MFNLEAPQMHIPPGPQRMRCNSLIFGWTLILVGLLLFPIGGFLLALPAWVIEAWQRWIRRGFLAQRNFCRATRLQSRV